MHKRHLKFLVVLGKEGGLPSSASEHSKEQRKALKPQQQMRKIPSTERAYKNPEFQRKSVQIEEVRT